MFNPRTHSQSSRDEWLLMDTSTSHPTGPSCWSRALQTKIGNADLSWAYHNSIMTPVEMRVIPFGRVQYMGTAVCVKT